MGENLIDPPAGHDIAAKKSGNALREHLMILVLLLSACKLFFTF
jgi:hypothetical protein